jgi:hypothetical protein
MKRLIVVCCIALGTAIALACWASPNGQAGNSPVYQFDITAGSGRLTIDLAKQSFVFKGKGFEPNKTYSLQYTVEGDPFVHALAPGIATPAGKLEIHGPWTGGASTLTTATFTVSMPSVGGVGLALDLTVWAAGTDYCLGPYYYAGSVIVTDPGAIHLGIGTHFTLWPTGTIQLFCGRYIQWADLTVNNTDYYTVYMFPQRDPCPASPPACP